MSYRILFLIAALTLSACAVQPVQSGAKAPTATAALYARLDAAIGRYEAARNTTGNGNADSAMAEATAALDDLQAASVQCAATRGCETQRFFAAFDRLLRLQRNAPAMVDVAADAATPDATAEAGESSPVAAALP